MAPARDFPRIIIAPLSMTDCFTTPALAFNVSDRYQCPVIILSDLLMAEGNETVDPALLDVEFRSIEGSSPRCLEEVTGARPPASRTSAQGHRVWHFSSRCPGRARPSPRGRER